SIALMKLDVLDVFKTIKFCVAYRLNGKTVAIPPDMDTNTLVDVKPVYELFKGWEQKTTEIRSFDKLPTNAKKYIQFLEKHLGSPVQIISVGAGRDQTLFKF
ncbi:MAG: adenylosuccinate synthetase, partial [Microgenomates group bacterium]